MPEWPRISEQELLDRLALDDRQFAAFIQALMPQVPPRAYGAASFAQVLGYPWARPAGSYRLTADGVELLADLSAADRDHALDQFAAPGRGRVPVLAFGSNAAPAVLERKFGHFPSEDDRAVLALTGCLHDFDVGASPQPAIYGAMPATLFPSPGTAVSATLLWVTETQFTQLAWSEISYRLGRLRTRFELDDGATSFEEVLAFVSRFGAFCVEERPVALAAIPASGRTAAALTQEQLLDAAAALAIGPDVRAEALVRAIFEDMGEIAPKIAATVHQAALPFASERWTPFTPEDAGR